MGADYRCPQCQSVLRKNAVDMAMSKAAGGVLTTRGGSSVYCPVCGFVISREDIWAGKYDVQDRKWWQFWKTDAAEVQEPASPSRGPVSGSPAISSGPVDPRLKRLITIVGAVDSPDKIVSEARFIEDLGFDSLDCVELIMAVEEELGMEIPDKDAVQLKTVGQAAAYMANPVERLESVGDTDEPAVAHRGAASANHGPAPSIRGSDTLVSMRDYGKYLGNLAKKLDTPNPDILYAHHEAFCAQCGIQFTREALAHLHLFGSGDFANLTVIGATQEGNDIRSGRCPKCGSTAMRIVTK